MLSDRKAGWDFTHHLRRLEIITDFSTWPRSDPASKRNGTSEPRSTKNTGGGGNVMDGLNTALSMASVGLAASGVRVLRTIIATPVAVGLQAGAIACGLLGASGRFICRKLEAKARKHDQIRVLSVSKLNSLADRISAALTNDKISEEEFRLILSEVDKYNQMKAEIRRGRQKGGGLPETEKKRLMNLMRDKMMLTARGKLLEELCCWKQWHLSINISCSRW